SRTARLTPVSGLAAPARRGLNWILLPLRRGTLATVPTAVKPKPRGPPGYLKFFSIRHVGTGLFRPKPGKMARAGRLLSSDGGLHVVCTLPRCLSPGLLRALGASRSARAGRIQ